MIDRTVRTIDPSNLIFAPERAAAAATWSSSPTALIKEDTFIMQFVSLTARLSRYTLLRSLTHTRDKISIGFSRARMKTAIALSSTKAN